MWAENIPLAKNFSRPVGLVSEHHAPAYSQPVQVGVSTRIGPGGCEAEIQAHPAVDGNAHAQLPVTNTAVIVLGIAIDVGNAAVAITSGDTRPQARPEGVNDVALKKPQGILLVNGPLPEVIVIAEK